MALERIYEIELETTGTSEPQFVDKVYFGDKLRFRPKFLLFNLCPQESGAAGLFQFTASSRASVLNGSAKWVDWDRGSVDVETDRAIFNLIGAWRLVSTTGRVLAVVRGA